MIEILLDLCDLCIIILIECGLLNVVCGVDLCLNWGEILCFVGEFGCGKLLIVMMLMGLGLKMVWMKVG